MQSLTSGALMRVSIFALGLLWSHDVIAQGYGQTNTFESQKQALNRIDQALSRVVTKAKKVTGKLGYGFFEDGCVFGVMLRPGTGASESFSLRAGQSYVFIGSGDNTARNVDVVIKDARGRVVGKDVEADATPFVLFQPKATGRYSMTLQLKSGWRGSAFCAVTVLRKGGYDLPIERIAQSATKVGVASAAIFRGVNGGRFNQDANTWALYGAVIRSGSAISSDPKRYQAANRGIVAVGDNSIKDLDLVLIDGNRKAVASDRKNGAAAGIAHKTRQGTYSIAMYNNSSSEPALVMTILLDLPANYKMPTAGTTNRRSTPPRAQNPYNPYQTQGTSPFEGDWEGDWADDRNGQEGTMKMRIKRDGSLSGHLYNETLRVTTKITGVATPNGTINMGYSYMRQPYLAAGNMKFTDNSHEEIEGRVSFSSNGNTFGAGNFYMSKN